MIKLNFSNDRFNLRRYNSNNKILRFGNDSGNKLNELLSLSNKIPAYKTSEVYKPGMMTIYTGGLSFEALKESNPNHPQITTKTQFWRHVTDSVQYVNQADLVSNITDEKCIALVMVSFKKNLSNEFSLLKKSNVANEDNTIPGKDYIFHFKK